MPIKYAKFLLPDSIKTNQRRGRIRNPVMSPAAKPSIIGKGKPGKIPLLVSMKKVMIEPAKIPIMAATVGKMLSGKPKNMVCGKLKNIAPVSME
jgi:hypothetical protein